MRKSIVLRHFYWKRLLFPFAFCSSWVVVGLVPPPKALVHFVHSSALGGGTLPTTITRKKGQKSTGAISNAKWRRKIPLKLLFCEVHARTKVRSWNHIPIYIYCSSSSAWKMCIEAEWYCVYTIILLVPPTKWMSLSTFANAARERVPPP